ncbi:hypothetical protein DPMN_175937 [Dreissena polymorpha]|uniref:Uncharacterized protein n=1 Tax=Dreissena polymorpha TaxID=45954 RepID=A0A9D4EA00_DREPO|nr:hypothetical protein DPMN_175937 [Dreissena polymorpha]
MEPVQLQTSLHMHAVCLRSYPVRNKVTEDFVVSLAAMVAPDQTVQMRRLLCRYVGRR